MATGIPKTNWNSNYLSSQVENSSNNNVAVYLFYEGKKNASDILATKPENLVKLGQIGKNINQLYYSDNLPVLASLLQNPEIRGKVRLIYIDPPFATQSIFQSRSQINAYQDLLSGSNYLEFIRTRLIILRELLSEDGSIYVHLDHKMIFYVKVLMDEIFGKNQFKNCITRQKCHSKNYTKKTYGKISDYILFYTKSDDYIWNRPLEAWSEEKVKKEYQYIEAETGRYYKKVPIHAPGIRNGETGKPWRGMTPPPGKHWQFTPKILDEMDARGEIFWSKNGNPRRKIYLDESAGIPVQDIWLNELDAYNQNIKITGYPTEKNPALLSRIIQASSNQGDLVLDCFSGSGTTLAVAADLQRKWIGIDSSKEAIFTTIERFTKGVEPMGDFVTKNKSSTPKEIDVGIKQLTLFNEIDQGLISPTKAPCITNFALYANEFWADDLKTINLNS